MFPARPSPRVPRPAPTPAGRELPLLLGFALAFAVNQAPSLAAATTPEPVVLHHENVMGTSCEIRIRAGSEDEARAAGATVLAEVDRLARVFSTYDASSEFSRWQITRDQPVPVSAELRTVLALADMFRTASGGVFHPAVGTLARAWKEAGRNGVPPDEATLARGREGASSPAWTLDPAAGTATRLGEAALTLDGIAKGWIVERAGERARKDHPTVRSLLVNIGGDMRHWGDIEERVDIAHPRADAENAPPLTSLRLRDAALATSGGYRRNVRIGGRTYSHIIDPRTGRPAEGVLGASVVAPDSATADALATILNLVRAEEMPGLAPHLARADWLVVRSDGTVEHSPGWSRRESTAPVTPLAASTPAAPAAARTARDVGWPAGYELRLDFELNRPDNSGRYARPYVAAWIEDSDAFPVRTLLLWLLQGEKGLRWLPDLRRWHRSDQVRALVDPRNLVGAVSSATRPPGRYSTVWDGKDDSGAWVKPGRYTLYLEASREHGTYQLVKHEFEIGSKAFGADLAGNLEIKSAAVAFGPASRPAAR